jgi:hypothetical protein
MCCAEGGFLEGVSRSCACIGSPCLRHCVHGASIGDLLAAAWRRSQCVTTNQSRACLAATACSAVCLASSLPHRRRCRRLSSIRFHPTARRSKQRGWTALMLAAREGYGEVALALLTTAGAEANSKSPREAIVNPEEIAAQMVAQVRPPRPPPPPPPPAGLASAPATPRRPASCLKLDYRLELELGHTVPGRYHGRCRYIERWHCLSVMQANGAGDTALDVALRCGHGGVADILASCGAKLPPSPSSASLHVATRLARRGGWLHLARAAAAAAAAVRGGRGVGDGGDGSGGDSQSYDSQSRDGSGGAAGGRRGQRAAQHMLARQLYGRKLVRATDAPPRWLHVDHADLLLCGDARTHARTPACLSLSVRVGYRVSRLTIAGVRCWAPCAFFRACGSRAAASRLRWRRSRGVRCARSRSAGGARWRGALSWRHGWRWRGWRGRARWCKPR